MGCWTPDGACLRRSARSGKARAACDFSPHDLLRGELADADHLVAVVRIRDDEDIVAEDVEDREIVGREAAKAARLLVLLVDADLAFEALLAMRQHRAPGLDEIVADDEVGRIGTIRIDRDIVGLAFDLVGRGAALDAAEIEVGLVIEAPQFVDQEPAIDIGIERRIGVDMDNRRHVPVIGLVHVGIDAKRALLQAPVFPHAHAVMHLAVAPLDRNGARQIQHVPDLVDPWADADHDIIAGDAPLVGQDGGHGLRVAAEFEAGDRGTGHDAARLRPRPWRRGRRSRRCCWRNRPSSRAGRR